MEKKIFVVFVRCVICLQFDQFNTINPNGTLYAKFEPTPVILPFRHRMCTWYMKVPTTKNQCQHNDNSFMDSVDKNLLVSTFFHFTKRNTNYF